MENINNKFKELEELKIKFEVIIGNFIDGVATVRSIAKCNSFHIDTDGNPLYSEVYEDVRDFSEGVGLVWVSNDKGTGWIGVDTSGKILYDTPFDICGDFKNGFAYVEYNEVYNDIDDSDTRVYEIGYINKAGKIVDLYAALKLADEAGLHLKYKP